MKLCGGDIGSGVQEWAGLGMQEWEQGQRDQCELAAEEEEGHWSQAGRG